jgi:hypothetical protein
MRKNVYFWSWRDEALSEADDFLRLHERLGGGEVSAAGSSEEHSQKNRDSQLITANCPRYEFGLSASVPSVATSLS